MSLGVIPIFWFENLGDFWRKITNKRKQEKLGTGPFAVAKGGLAEGKKRPSLGFAAAKPCFAAVKTLFIMIKFRIFVSKVMYSCTDSLGILINDQ